MNYEFTVLIWQLLSENLKIKIVNLQYSECEMYEANWIFFSR